MIVREAKLLNGYKAQYQALDEAIRTAQFIRNKGVRLWRDQTGVNKARLSLLCKELAREFHFARKLNSMARPRFCCSRSVRVSANALSCQSLT